MTQHVPSTKAAPKVWRGRFYEDFDVGDVFRSRFGRTITEADNTWSALVTLNMNQIHFNAPYAERSRTGQMLVLGGFTVGLIGGLSVSDTSENAAANLGWTDVTLPKPVVVGDTLWTESEVLEKRESNSKPNVGIVTIRTRGINQRREVVLEYRRTFMVYKRDAPEVADTFPVTDEEWTI
jgi:acyl dehydratase